jgi:putative glutamine amidotransferase
MAEQTPIIGILCDDKLIAPHHFHCAGDKYVRAISDACSAIPLLIPALGNDLPFDELLSRVDGLLLPGAYSNIDPTLYGQHSEETDPIRDPARDSSALGLITRAVEIGLPVFAICRGFQEVNVALGGSLYQKVQCAPGFNDHRENSELPLEQQYADVHEVSLNDNGLLQSISGCSSVQVNSLHQQGIKELASPLQSEAAASDGLIEAYSLNSDTQFLLGVQWHPEWQLANNPFNLSLFTAFKQACIEYKNR